MAEVADKLIVENLYKIFGPAPEEALRLAREGLDRNAIFRRNAGVVAVDDVSLRVREREVFVVMGLSGSGKSTLARCLNRLFEPTAGSIRLDGEELVEAPPAALRRIRLERIAMVFQHFALLPHKTVLENAAFGLKMRGMARAERHERARRALDTVGLAGWAESLPEACSGGMQQRVGLARALAVDPELLLMDEPFSALDPLIRRDMQDELIELQRSLRTTIVFITHDLHEALKLGDRIAIMKDGRFVQVGTPEEIVTAPADEYVAAFTRDVDRGRVLTLGAVMRPALVLAPDCTLAEAGRQLREAGAGAALVGKAGNGAAPEGLLTAADLSGHSGELPVRAVMRREIPEAPAERHLADAFAAFAGGALAVRADGRLAGLVEPAQVLGALRDRAGA